MENQFTIGTIAIIVWLIFPGVVFKRFYFQGQFTKQFGSGLFADRLITSVFWGIIVQIITFLIYSKSLGFTLAGIKDKVNDVYSNVLENKLPDETYQYMKYLLLYLICLVVMAAILGSIFHKIIRLFKIDIKLEVFRFSNHWNYYFKGEILSTRDFKPMKRGSVLFTMVDILMEDNSEKTKMVQGLLTQYTLSHKTGDLETIYLTQAKRWSETLSAFKDIPGDCFIVPFERVIDMNIRYIVKIVDKGKQKQKIYNIIAFFGLSVGILSLIIFPWYLSVGLIHKLLGMASGIIAWAIFIAFISNPFQTDNKAKLTIKSGIAAALIMLIFAALSLTFFNLLPLWV